MKYRDQIVCALIVASVSYAGFELAGAVSYLLIVMLAGNVWEARRRARAHLRKHTSGRRRVPATPEPAVNWPVAAGRSEGGGPMTTLSARLLKSFVV